MFQVADRPAPIANPDFSRDLPKLRKDITDMEAIIRNPNAFYGFESGYENTQELLDAARKKAEKLSKQVEASDLEVKRHQKHIQMTKLGYPWQMDLSALSARKPNGLPALMVLSKDSRDKTFSIIIDPVNNWRDGKFIVRFSPVLPQAMQDQFAVAVEALNKLRRQDEGTMITAKYEGFMPADARKAFDKAVASKLFKEIYIFIEAPEWTVSRWASPRTMRKDPFVEGWVEETQQLYHITSYDVTKFEQYLLDQFHIGA